MLNQLAELKKLLRQAEGIHRNWLVLGRRLNKTRNPGWIAQRNIYRDGVRGLQKMIREEKNRKKI